MQILGKSYRVWLSLAKLILGQVGSYEVLWYVQAYKYVPFGPVEEVMPYLIRRAQENSDIMSGVKREKSMMWSEIWRRITRRS